VGTQAASPAASPVRAERDRAARGRPREGLIYRLIVARLVRRAFEAVGSGDAEAATGDVDDDVHHIFPGDNALGGERHSKTAMIRWFQRLFYLIPELNFEVKKVAVRGWPWSTVVLVEWRDWGEARDGVPYENEGAHAIHMRWGKADYIHAYLDTEKVSAICERLARSGVEEASAPPITG
jgi:ketosteroid isomerase-like protein